MPICRTDQSLAGPILRLTLAGVMFPHGAQKVLGWWNGHAPDAPTGLVEGFEHWAKGFAAWIDQPVWVAYLVAAAEFLGSLALLAGFLTRFCALAIAAVMGGAIYYAHRTNGFFMDWYGKADAGMAGEGWEYHVLAIGCALALVARGAGRWSLDGRMCSGAPDLGA